MAAKILVFGELLYDRFGEKAEIGGAPFNFAAHMASLGENVDFVSAVGDDELGGAALEELKKKNVGAAYTAVLPKPTGFCRVTLREGIPSYDLARGVAYDYIPVPCLEAKYDAFYFGTLAQRAAVSRNSLRMLLKGSYREVFCDVNLRKPFYSADIIEESIAGATILKLSREEAPVLLAYTEPEQCTAALLARYPFLRQIVLTLDKDGAVVHDREKGFFHAPKPAAKAVSTVGAGDAFGACYLHHLLKGDGIEEALAAATLLADYVVTRLGAVPELPAALKERII